MPNSNVKDIFANIDDDLDFNVNPNTAKKSNAKNDSKNATGNKNKRPDLPWLQSNQQNASSSSAAGPLQRKVERRGNRDAWQDWEQLVVVAEWMKINEDAASVIKKPNGQALSLIHI